MSEVTKVKETAEAICSALHRTNFEYLGDSRYGQETWFHRGQRPRDIRVCVSRDERESSVKVKVEWRNYSNTEPVKGEKVFMVPINYGDRTLHEASTQVVSEVLNIFLDVVRGTGVAGPQALEGRNLGNRRGTAEHDGNE